MSISTNRRSRLSTTFTLLLGSLLTFLAPARAQQRDLPEVPSRLEYRDMSISRSLDGKTINISYKIGPAVHLSTQEILYVYSTILSQDGSRQVALDTLCVSGNTRHKAIHRQETLGGTRPEILPEVDSIYLLSDLRDNGYMRRISIPFERWMAKGKVVFTEKIFGCTSCGVGMARSERPIEGLHVFGPDDYRYDFYVPQGASRKYYAEEFDCKVHFKVAQHTLLPDFDDNRYELDRLDAFIRKALSLEGATLEDVVMRGYASPEGEFVYNRKLAERRTKALSDYVRSKYPQLLKAKRFETEGIGEDWAGLEELVKGSALPAKEEVLSAIQNHDTDTQREAAIRAIHGGEVYATMLSELYPLLRRTQFCMSFEVRPYQDSELEGIFAKVPGLLSQTEMSRLADQYVAAGKSPLPVYKAAYDLHSDDVVAALNYANALLKYSKDADATIRVLEPFSTDPRSYYPLAIAYDVKGQWQQSEAYLEKYHSSK